jgi:hypothetical protein
LALKPPAYYQMGLNLLSMVYATGDLHVTFRSDGLITNTLSGSWSGTGVSYTSGDIITVTYDNATNACSPFIKTASTSATFTVSGTPQSSLNFGVFYGGSGNTNYTLNAGQRPFAYPVSGFKALCTTNLPEPTIADGSTAMDVVTRAGGGTTQTFATLKPGLVWEKRRDTTSSHYLFDVIRGNDKYLSSNTTSAEGTTAGAFTFNTNSYTVSSGFDWPGGATVVDWVWDAGSSTVTNTEGSITSQVRANASAGFSVVTLYSGDNSTSGSVGHGLGVAPSMVIIKARNASKNWKVAHVSLPAQNMLTLNETYAIGIAGWDGVTSTVFKPARVGDTYNNTSGENYVAYCFAPVAGYSSFGSYTGNGSTNGPFVYTGFRPRWVLFKKSSAAGDPWFIYDSVRDTFNVAERRLNPNNSGAESQSTVYSINLLSNGFKINTDDTSWNASGATFIYAAFAEHPFSISRAR